MKFTPVVTSVFLAVVGVTSAYAQSVNLTLSGPNVTALADTNIGGGPVTLYTYTVPAGTAFPTTAAFNGTLTNGTLTSYTYDGSSYTPALTGGVTENDYLNDFVNNPTLNPITVNPGLAGTVTIGPNGSIQDPVGLVDFLLPAVQSTLDSGCSGPAAPVNIPANSVLCGFFNLSDSAAQANGDPNANVGAWYDIVETPSAVPEPSILALFASGLVGGSVFLRRRK